MTPMTNEDEEATDETSVPPPSRADANILDRYRDPAWGTAIMRMVPNPDAPDYRRAPWVVRMKVRCEHVSRLMDEGFHWSTGNVLPEEGSMSHALQDEWTAKGFRHARQWMLADKAPGHETPQWVAHLEVISPFLEVLARFPLHDLSAANICSANAWDPRGRLVYNYNCRTPDRNYNCLYDLRPLQGWWPWPKKDMLTDAPVTLTALTAAPWVSEDDGGSKGGTASGKGDELFDDLPVKPLVRTQRRPQPQLSQDQLEAYRQRLNHYRESLIQYQTSMLYVDPWGRRRLRVADDSCVIL
jgi:hypothetical protein